MEFCDKCGSYMTKTKEGLLCRKCGNLVHYKAEVPTRSVEKTDDSSPVCLAEDSEYEQFKVDQVCPECGNKEAYKWYSGVSGEHAGIGREKTVEHFKCTKCSHSWSKAS